MSFEANYDNKSCADLSIKSLSDAIESIKNMSGMEKRRYFFYPNGYITFDDKNHDGEPLD